MLKHALLLFAVVLAALFAALAVGPSRLAAPPNDQSKQTGPPTGPPASDKALLDELRWSITIRTIATNVYGKARSDLLYLGEPLVVDVSVSNKTKEEINLPRPFDAVVAQGAWKIDKIVNGKARGGPATVKETRADKGAKVVTLAPGKGAELWVRLADVETPGRYRLTFTPPWGRAVGNSREFEIGVPRTQQEIMGMHLHKAMRLEWAGELDEAERELRMLLEMNPNSAVGYNELAAIRAKQNRMPEAIQCTERAIELAETGADKFSNMPAHVREEWAGELRAIVKLMKQKAGQ